MSQPADYTQSFLRIGQRITERRETLGLTQAELGELIHTSQQNVSHIESDTQGNITLRRLADIAEALQTPLEGLLADKQVVINADNAQLKNANLGYKIGNITVTNDTGEITEKLIETQNVLIAQLQAENQRLLERG